LELSLDRIASQRFQFHVSYVLSKSYGNYTGLFASDQGYLQPGTPLSLQAPDQAPNSLGLLPNDRTHVLKLYGSYRFPFGLTAGTFFTVQSGTPLNQFGMSTSQYFGLELRYVFLVPRGSAGRSPTIFDLNARLAYDLRLPGRTSGRVIMDVLHVGNPQQVVWLDQVRYLAPLLSSPNSSFGRPLARQLPMQARLGLEIGY
jgi:hypothetical protein